MMLVTYFTFRHSPKMFLNCVLILLAGITKAEKQPILTGSSDLAMEGEKYTLSCNIKTIDMYWARNGGRIYRMRDLKQIAINPVVNTSNYTFSVGGGNMYYLTIKNISYQTDQGVNWTCEYWDGYNYAIAEYSTTVGVAISTVLLISRQVNEEGALVIEDGAMFQISCSTPFASPKPAIKMCVITTDSVLPCTPGNVHLRDNKDYIAEFNVTATLAMDNHRIICYVNNNATTNIIISSNEVSIRVLPNEYAVKNHDKLIIAGSAGGVGFIIIVITVILGGIIYKRRRTAKEVVASNRMSASQQNQHNRQNVLNQGTEHMEPNVLENDMYASADVNMDVDNPGPLAEGPVYGKVHKTIKQGPSTAEETSVPVYGTVNKNIKQGNPTAEETSVPVYGTVNKNIKQGKPTAEETSVPVYGTVNKNKTTDSISEAIDGPVYGVVNKRSKKCSKTQTVSIHGEGC